jgi:hypothetical protein
MERNRFNEVVEKRIKLITDVLAKKGKEYSGDKDVFHNFKNATGISFHEAPEKVAWEFMTKHLMSIKDMLDKVEQNPSQEPTQELIEEKIGDAINYLILIEGMLKERIEDPLKP